MTQICQKLSTRLITVSNYLLFGHSFRWMQTFFFNTLEFNFNVLRYIKFTFYLLTYLLTYLLQICSSMLKLCRCCNFLSLCRTPKCSVSPITNSFSATFLQMRSIFRPDFVSHLRPCAIEIRFSPTSLEGASVTWSTILRLLVYYTYNRTTDKTSASYAGVVENSSHRNIIPTRSSTTG